MADTKNSERARMERQRLAVLALAAAKKRQTDECLAPEELAALVDGICSKEQHHRFMGHLSGCDSCYREWLSICRERTGRVEGTGYKRIFSLVSNRRFLAAAGSACALAVSVMIFWSTPFQQDERLYGPAGDTLSVPGTSGEHKDRKTEGESEKTGVLLKRMAETDQSDDVEHYSDMSAVPVEATPEEIDSETAAPQTAAPVLKQSARNNVAEPDYLKEETVGAAAGFAADDKERINEYERFQALVLAFCREGENGDSSDSKLRKSGSYIRAQTGSYTVQQRAQVEKILELLDATEYASNRKKTCEQILELISAGDT